MILICLLTQKDSMAPKHAIEADQILLNPRWRSAEKTLKKADGECVTVET